MGHDKIIVTYDQARFTLDADVRRCWAFKGTTPIVYKNGSKESISIGGAYSSTNKFHFYQMDWQVKENVLENIRLIHKEFPNFFLSLIKQHGIRINSLKVIFKRTTFHICFFPTGASDLNPTEECWNQTRAEVTANKSHNSKEQLLKNLGSVLEK